METLLLGSWNLQNSIENRMGEEISPGQTPAKLIANYVEEKNYDLFGTQELTWRFSQEIQKNLNRYKIYDEYRYGETPFVRFLPRAFDHNESNAFLTTRKMPPIMIGRLPSFPGLSKTVNIAYYVEDKNRPTVLVANTRLEQKNRNVQIKQLRELRNILAYFPPETFVLLGDFGMDTRENTFQAFQRDLKRLGLKRVPIDESTYAINPLATDHIFVPTSWDILDCGIDRKEDLLAISEHEIIYTKVLRK